MGVGLVDEATSVFVNIGLYDCTDSVGRFLFDGGLKLYCSGA